MEMRKFELHRQVFHILLGLMIVFLLLYDIIDKNILLIFALIGLIFSYLSRKIDIPVIKSLLEKFERKENIKNFPGKGIIFYLIGAYAALLLFPKEIALASVMILALADSVSHLFGLHYGKIKNPLSSTKFIEGTVAGFAAGFLGAIIFLPWHEALLASLAASMAEAVEIKIGAQQVDDNLVMPFVAGAVVWIARLF